MERVLNYDSGKVHYAQGDREEIAKTLPADLVTADQWWWWRTACGARLIGHAVEGAEVTCQRCVQAYAAAERAAERLRARFG